MNVQKKLTNYLRRVKKMSEIFGILKTEELVDKLCELDKEKKAVDLKIKQYQAELQARGLRILEDRNLKYKEFYGCNGARAEITYTQSLEVLNYFALKGACGEIFDEYVKRIPEYKYSYDKKFEATLKAIFTEDYTAEMTVEDIIDRCFKADSKQKALLLKKLKGEYKKDKELLESVLSIDNDIEVELDYIHKAINWKRIKMYFPENTERVISEIKKNLIVTSTPKIGVKYEAE